MKDLVELIAKKLVAHPDEVQVTVVESEEGETIELRVNPEDMGRVIGKAGRTAKAIRALVSAAGSKAGKRASLQIVE
ncbi:MAG: KH domain-containing protein [Candidatus Hydrogenedentes bacterium]|nr:KH domain-containing protein [Candidatus Hydrogenedentota bacterium]